MSAIRVSVTAELIDAFPDVHKEWDGSVKDALQELTGQDVNIDGDGETGYMATIGAKDDWTLVIGLPEAAGDFLDYRWENGGPGDPFDFETEVPEWVRQLVDTAVDYVSPDA